MVLLGDSAIAQPINTTLKYRRLQSAIMKFSMEFHKLTMRCHPLITELSVAVYLNSALYIF
jgi:hypothetical protein